MASRSTRQRSLDAQLLAHAELLFEEYDHLPILTVLKHRIVGPHVPPGLPTFWAMVGLGVPIAVVAAWLFAVVFEIPFQRYRSWRPLWAATRARWEG